MTIAAVVSSSIKSSRLDPDLINAILTLSEKDFRELVDIRLNRPKKLDIVEHEDGQKELVIIDQNGKSSIVERWLTEYLVDKLFLQLATTKSTVISHNASCGITVYKYYNQAFRLFKWIPIADPVPEFIIDASDLDGRLRAELMVLEYPQYVLNQAVGRIFENIDERKYHLSIARKLKVRLSAK